MTVLTTGFAARSFDASPKELPPAAPAEVADAMCAVCVATTVCVTWTAVWAETGSVADNSLSMGSSRKPFLAKPRSDSRVRSMPRASFKRRLSVA